jgi:hypothetical protein
MSRLKAIAPKAAEPAKPKVLIYGKPGVGKTWFALDFPRCYYIDTEGGANLRHYIEKLDAAGGVYLGPEQGANDFGLVLDQIKALATERHEYRTLVLDSVSHIFGSEIASTQDRMADENKKDEYGASRKGAISYTRRMVNWLDRVDMNVVLIAHQKDEYGPNPKVPGERVVIGETFDCWDKLEYILHLALQITKQGQTRKARVRKSRLLGFPDADAFDLSYDAFADRYGRDVIEGIGKVIELVTTEQIAELRVLMDSVRMPDDWLDKCLKRGKADTIEEMSTDAVAAMVKMLKERVPT